MARARCQHSICWGLCVVLFMWPTLSLCDDPFALICAIEGFDYYNLTIVTWFLNLTQKDCLLVNQTQSQCMVDLAICHVNSDLGPCQNSSVCLKSDHGDLSLGAYRQNPFNPLSTESLIKGFHTTFLNGSQYSTADNTSCTLQTDLVFECNSSSIWDSSGTLGARKRAPDPKMVSYNNNTCQLSITFSFAGACKREGFSGKHFSPGTVLIAIFLVSVILYFAFGSMINLARGRVGGDTIPHAKFWAMLPVYIIDGFQFVFCCGRVPVTASYEEIR